MKRINDIETLCSKKLEDQPNYSFIGGLRYGENNISIESKSVIEYPYTTYYTNKVLPFTHEGEKFIPLSEINMPLIVLQFEDYCLAAEIEPVIQTDKGPAYHFIGYNPEEKEIKIALPDNIEKKEKKAEWLGIGERKSYDNPSVKEYQLEFEEFDSWKEVVQEKIQDETAKTDAEIREQDFSREFLESRDWLYRSWDDDQGTFLQLPWRERPGFALNEYSYSLTSNEAVRLNYFDELSGQGLGDNFRYWCDRLKELFKNPELQKRDLKHGEGMIWYNTVSFNGESLEGEFYLGTGYYGYPGGQSTISYNILEYLERNTDSHLEKLVRENLDYILSTQKKSGHWPAASKQEMELPLKEDDYYGLKSEGATGESVKALLKAWNYFDEEKYVEAARKGLQALETDKPVCRNGLRDIGSEEVEGFSAFAVIEAFLEAYEKVGEEKYLEQAETYSLYLSTWISWYSGEKFDLRGICHPISETITQRISPFETIKAAKTFLKASRHLENDIWKDLASKNLEKSLEYRNDTKGMSEGIFYDFKDGLNNLETEQTFATAELLYTLKKFEETYSGIKIKPDTEEEKDSSDNLDLEIEGNEINIDEETVFDIDRIGFSKVKGEEIDQELCFNGPYSLKSSLRSKAFSKLRKSKFFLAPKDVSYLWKGIRPKKLSIQETRFGDVEKSVKAELENGKAIFNVETEIYDISGTLSGSENGINVDFEISTDKHDLICKNVALEASEPSENKTISKKSFALHLDNSEDSEKGFDLSRKANWTDGGIYRGRLELEFN